MNKKISNRLPTLDSLTKSGSISSTIESNLAPRLRNETNEINYSSLIPHPRCDFFCFIPLSLGAKLEFQYIGIGLFTQSHKVRCSIS